jgi:fluoride ion exporter CrcB/FEX
MTAVVQSRADSTFPVGTLAVNVLGCLLIGIVFQLATNSGRLSPATEALARAVPVLAPGRASARFRDCLP